MPYALKKEIDTYEDQMKIYLAYHDDSRIAEKIFATYNRRIIRGFNGRTFKSFINGLPVCMQFPRLLVYGNTVLKAILMEYPKLRVFKLNCNRNHFCDANCVKEHGTKAVRIKWRWQHG